jgi:hypothetical protein
VSAGDERRRVSTTPPASPQPTHAASPAAALRVPAERASPTSWPSSQPLAADRDASPAQQARPQPEPGASGFSNVQRRQAEPYSQPNGVFDDGDAMVDWADATAHVGVGRSPPGSRA